MPRSMLAAVALCGLVTAGPALALDPKLTQDDRAPVAQAQAQPAEQNQSGGSPLGGIFGCSADGKKQGLAAVIGGAAGALLGNRIAGRGNRTLGTLLGGAVGAAAGSAVGCKLQKNDRDKAERAAEEALATGESQSWSNAETGASGRFDVADDADGGGLGQLRFASGVEPASGYAKVAGSYTTTANSRVRSGPSTRSAIRGTLPIGQRVWVPAQVSGQPWMLISEDGIGQGYVHSSLLKRVSAPADNCKRVTQTVSLPGEAAQAETYQACKDADGQWVMTRV